jgi:large subunit ribosomal protein L18
MDKNKQKAQRWAKRKRRVRRRIFGTPEKPRLSVFRSNQHIYAQLINDVEGRTLTSASTVQMERGGTTDAASEVGKRLAENAKSAGVQRIVFDRSGYRFHGRVKALADAAREGGLEF